MGGRTDGTSDGRSDGDRGIFEEDEESLHEEGEVGEDVVAKNLEVGVEGSAGRLLSEGVGDVVEKNLKSTYSQA